MSTSSSSLRRHLRVNLSINLAWLLLWQIGGLPCQAFQPNVIRLQGKNTASNLDFYRLGQAVAVNDRWAVVGEPGNSEPSGNNGAVHVFSAVSGQHLRRWQGDPAIGGAFGETVAVSGDMALIGASFAGKGAAYLFDLRTGQRLRKFVPLDAVNGDRFGCSVGLDGRFAVIGAFQANAPASKSGAVYVFDALTGAQLWKLNASNAGADDWFGSTLAVGDGLALILGDRLSVAPSVYLFDLATGVQLHQMTLQSQDASVRLALSARRALIGLPLDSTHVAGAGAAALYDCNTGTLIKRFTPPDGTAGESFGSSVALNGPQAVIGARSSTPMGANSGSIYLYDLLSFTSTAKIHPGDGKAGALFGDAAALYGNTVLVGAYFDSTQATQSGAAYLFKSVSSPPAFDAVAALGDSAQGTAGSRLGSFREVLMGANGGLIFGAGLTGPEVTNGRNRGLWKSSGSSLSLVKSAQTGTDIDPGVRVSSIFSPLSNQPDTVYFQGRLTGADDVSGHTAIFRHKSSLPTSMIWRTGETLPALNSGVLRQFRQVLQTTDSARSLAVVYRLRTGTAGINSGNDTGILTLNSGIVVAAPIKEGFSFGEITRAAYANDFIAFHHFISDAAADQNRIIRKFNPAQGGSLALVAMAGGNASGITNAKFRSFLGETISSEEEVTFKASVTGPDITSANRSGLWSQRFGTNQLVARIGSQVPGLPTGVVWRQLLRFWALSMDGVLFHARLGGPGINSTNDQVLALSDENGALQILLREGDPMPGCPGGRVGSFQTMAAESLANHYAVLVSIAGVPPQSNQALLLGKTSLPIGKKALRRPYLALRKGGLLQSPGGTSSFVRSIRLSADGMDANGAGAKGLGQPLSSQGKVAASVTMANRSVMAVEIAP